MEIRKMTPRNKKLEISISRKDYGLFGPLSPSTFSPISGLKKNRTGGRKRQLFYLFVLSGLVLCLLCYASYFPAGWITDVDSSTNSFLHKLGSKQHISIFKDIWKNRIDTPSNSLLYAPNKKVSGKNQDLSIVMAFGDHRNKPIWNSEKKEKQSCNFPRLNPFDPSILEFIKEPPNIDCFANYPLVFRTNFHNKLIQVNKLENATCCYKTVTRGNESDQNIRYSKSCYQISEPDTEIPAEHEFISVKCTRSVISNETHKLSTATIHKDMFAFVPLKSHLESSQRQLHSDPLSIIILGLDAQSHMNFLRQMPTTYKYLVQNLSSIPLNGYNKVGDNTFPNVVPLLTGLSVAELKKVCWSSKSTYFDECPFIWKKFSEAGYRTSFSEDSIWMGTFNYEKKGFMNPPTHYYLHPLSLLMAKKIGHSTWGNAKLCYGPRLAFEILLDYIVKTAVTFNAEGERKLYFQYVWANSLFHDYLNNPKLGDELLFLTLEYMNRNGYLNNTLLLILSDHGIRWGSIRSTYQGKIEERMPMAYFTFPPWFRRKYPKAIQNLEENAKERLTTPFDIHETLLDILSLQKDGHIRSSSNRDNRFKRGQSLFDPIGADRTCKSAGIEEHWCVCNSLKSIPKNSSLVNKAADFIVKTINTGLLKFSAECAKLSLYKINEAMRKIDGDIDTGVEVKNTSVVDRQISDKSLETDTEDIKSTINSKTKGDRIQLQITLVTKPGFGVFEATVYGSFDGNLWNISGEISRLNLYREQSLCIRDPIGQKYCYCMDNQTEDEEINSE